MAGGRRNKSKTNTVERFLPLAYFAAALALVLVLLPTTLRPPQQPPSQTAELSPDAPPDPNQQSIISSLNRGVSETAGATEGELGDGVPAVPVVLKKTAPRSCPLGTGNPPRQVQSLYSAPCSTWAGGDNGGATYQGVTANEIRVAINGTNAGASDPCALDELPSTAPPGECASDRTFRVFMQYFNQNFQFYGRRLRFFVAQPPTTMEEDVRTAAVKGAEEYKVFAAGGLYAPGCQEYARRKLVSFCAQLPRDEYERWDPYVWSFHMDGTELVDQMGEYVCRKLVGKPAVHANDLAYRTTPRKFGWVYFSTRDYAANGPRLTKALEACKATVVPVAATPDTSSTEGQAALATVISRFKAEGVTTVIPGMDAISQITLTTAAESNAYFPEWIVSGAGANTANAIAQLMNQHQWAAAFGLTPFEAERRDELHDCWRAYRSIDPNNEPNYTVCKALFPSYLQLANAIQLAGPNLTPQTFAAGLYKMGVRYYNKPLWVAGGGFGAPEGRHNYIHNVAHVWYSPTQQDPQYNNTLGAYMYEQGGRRYRLGEQPVEDRSFNPDGAVPTPADAASFGDDPEGEN